MLVNRFVSVSNTNDFVENQRNVSITRMTECRCRLLSNWLWTKKEFRSIKFIEPEKLNAVELAEFFLYAHKSDKKSAFKRLIIKVQFSLLTRLDFRRKKVVLNSTQARE
jgi:hypothetical protein